MYMKTPNCSMAKKPKGCAYCYGYGLSGEFLKIGYRRPCMKPCPDAVPCDRCGQMSKK